MLIKSCVSLYKREKQSDSMHFSLPLILVQQMPQAIKQFGFKDGHNWKACKVK